MAIKCKICEKDVIFVQKGEEVPIKPRYVRRMQGANMRMENPLYTILTIMKRGRLCEESCTMWTLM